MLESPVLQGLSYRTKRFLKRNSSTVLTWSGATGVIVTSVMTAKATTKASILLEKAQNESEEVLTKTEKIKIAGPVYIPAILFGVGTISCIFGANILNKRSQAALTGAYVMLDQSYKEYKSKVEELYGEEADNNIRQEIAKDNYEKIDIVVSDKNELFYDEYSKRYFESTIEAVQEAQYKINRNLVIRDYAYLNEWYEELGLPPIDGGYKLGWSMGQCMDYYWQSWIDFSHEKIVMIDGTECQAIRICNEPVIDFENYC